LICCFVSRASERRLSPWAFATEPGDLAVLDPTTRTWMRPARSPSGFDYRVPPVWGGHRLVTVDASGRLLTLRPASHPV